MDRAMRRAMSGVMAVMWLICPPLVIAAADDKSRHYIMGVDDTRYLPQYDHDGDQLLGYAREFFDEFARQRGIQFEYRVFPVNRLYQVFLIDRSIDFKYPDDSAWRPDLRRDTAITYSLACAEYIDGVLVLPGNKGRGIDQLKKLGMVRGFTPVDYQSRITQGLLQVDETGSITGMLQMALRGRVDGAFVNVAVGRYQLQHSMQQPGALVFDDKLPHYRGGYSLSTIKHPELIADLNQFMQHNASWIQALKNRYQLTLE